MVAGISSIAVDAWHAGGQESESPWLHLDLRHRLTTVILIFESDSRIGSD